MKKKSKRLRHTESKHKVNMRFECEKEREEEKTTKAHKRSELAG
jgi:hypothetical protein